MDLKHLLDYANNPCRSAANWSAQAVAGYWTACSAGLHEQSLVIKVFIYLSPYWTATRPA